MGTVIATAIGILAGAAIAYVIARRVVHRPRLAIGLTQTLVLSTGDFDIHDSLSFSIRGRNVDSICALMLEVSCKGQKDIVVGDAGPPRAANATPLPRLDLEDFRIIAVRTLNNDSSRFYIPIARGGGGKSLFLNIHRLRARTTARFQIVGELEGGRRSFAPEQCHLFPGAIPDVNVETSGCISRPWLRQ